MTKAKEIKEKMLSLLQELESIQPSSSSLEINLNKSKVNLRESIKHISLFDAKLKELIKN